MRFTSSSSTTLLTVLMTASLSSHDRCPEGSRRSLRKDPSGVDDQGVRLSTRRRQWSFARSLVFLFGSTDYDDWCHRRSQGPSCSRQSRRARASYTDLIIYEASRDRPIHTSPFSYEHLCVEGLFFSFFLYVGHLRCPDHRIDRSLPKQRKHNS